MGTLFATTVANAKPAEKDYKLSDGAGLYLLVRPNGSKLWRFNYVHCGKHRTLAFGAWPDVGLADARGKRDEARRLIAAGLDPSHEEKVARAKARVEENDTFKTVAKEWIAKLERESMAEITLSKIRWLLDMAYPKIGNRPIAKITTQEVLVVLRAVEATGRYESARRMRSVLGRVFRYAVATTRAERDPTGDLRGALTVPKAKHLAAITNPKRAGELMRAIRRMDNERTVTAASNDPFQQSVAAGRLRRLGTMGLAEDLGHGRWRLADGIEDTLRRMGERGDIIRTMQRELTARKLDRAGVDRRIHDTPSDEIIGRVIHRGFSDEHRDRHYLIVDGVDGRVHYLDIGRGDLTEPTPEESIVRITPRIARVRNVDRTVAEVAKGNGGRYSIDAHLRHDAGASQGFAETHVRRLEAMRQAGAGVERNADGSWTIAADHLDHAAGHEARGLRDRPVDIETVSTMPIARLVTADAATWLDRQIGAVTPVPVRDAGFGREVRSSLDVRRQWLVQQELADMDGNKVRLRANAITLLQRRELLGAGDRLAGELGKSFVEARVGSPVEGRLTRRVDLMSGRFALVEQSREFTLVPWRPVLEKQIGNQVSGLMRSDGLTWRFGRYRAGPTIS